MINYYKGKQIYLSADSETQKVITLVNEPNECFMRVVAPALFFEPSSISERTMRCSRSNSNGRSS